MKAFLITVFIFVIALTSWASSMLPPIDPPDSLYEITVPYRTRNNFYVIPVLINDSLRVNMLLDPRCKSVILFGKRYQKLLDVKRKNYEAKIASGNERTSLQSFHNKISIGPALGENIPIVVLPNSNPFNFFTSVNGVMGYGILSDCEVTIDKKTETMTIRMTSKNVTATAMRFK